MVITTTKNVCCNTCKKNNTQQQQNILDELSALDAKGHPVREQILKVENGISQISTKRKYTVVVVHMLS